MALVSAVAGPLTISDDWREARDNVHVSQPVVLGWLAGSAVPARFKIETEPPAVFMSEADTWLETIVSPDAYALEALKAEIYGAWAEFRDAVGYFDRLTVFDDIEDKQDWHIQSIKAAENMTRLSGPENVLEFVRPERDAVLDCTSRHGDVVVTLYLSCDWDDEHGLALVSDRNGLHIE